MRATPPFGRSATYGAASSAVGVRRGGRPTNLGQMG